MLIREDIYQSKNKKELIEEIINLKAELRSQKEKDIYIDWFNNTDELIHIVSYEGNIIDVNKAVVDKYGYSKSELIGKSGEILAAPGLNDIEESNKKFAEVIKTGKAKKLDWWSRKKNGQVFPKEFIIRKATYGGQDVMMLCGRDISERIEFEQKLIRSEIRYKSLFERNLAGIYRTTLDGEIIDCNPAFATILGYNSKVELIGKVNAQDLYQDKKYRSKSIDKIIKNQSITGNRINLIKKDKSQITVLVSTTAIKNPQKDKIEYMEGTVIDITELVNAERLVEESRQSYRLLLDSSPFGVILHDKGNIVLANKKAREMMGVKDINRKKVTVFDFIFEKDHKMAAERIVKTYEGEDLPFQEYQLKRLDGKTINVETKTNLIDFQEKKVLLISFHDVTRIKELEKEKIRNQLIREINQQLTQELEEKNKIQKKLVASEDKLKTSLLEKEVLLKEVHHRVKNNLQVISSIFNLQKNYSTNETVKDILIESQNRIKSMAFIHESLYKTVDFASINFSEYAENLCQNLLKTYHSQGFLPDLEIKKQDVYLNLDFAIPCGLILNELMTNAIKYAFKGRDSGVVNLNISKNNKEVKIFIADNGIGMPEDINFEDSNTLGFQLVNALVSQLNGEVSFEVKNGTAFTIKFTTK